MSRSYSAIAVVLWSLGWVWAAAQTPAPTSHPPAPKPIRTTGERALSQSGAATVHSPKPSAPLRPFPEVERDYLQGRITARQFQQYLERYVARVNAHHAASQGVRTVRVTSKPLPRADSSSKSGGLPALPTSPPASAGSPPASAASAALPASPPIARAPAKLTNAPALGTNRLTLPDDEFFKELDRRMEKLMRWQAEREKRRTNALSRTRGPLDPVRRQLNELLRLYLEGKITKPEYEARRAKVLESD